MSLDNLSLVQVERLIASVNGSWTGLMVLLLIKRLGSALHVRTLSSPLSVSGPSAVRTFLFSVRLHVSVH